MRKISRLVIVLLTSVAITFPGFSATSEAMANENETVTSTFRFPIGSSMLTNTQKTVIKKAVETSGTDSTFLVTVEAGKLSGVSDDEVQKLAKKRGKAVKAYLVELGVNKSSVTTKVKITRLGVVPKTELVGKYAAPVPSGAPSSSTPPSASPSPSLLACASGGTCVVGDTGPGGGIVYYVDADGFKCGASFTSTAGRGGGLCKYLEVAPSGWFPEGDPAEQWATGTSNSGNASQDVIGIVNDNDTDFPYNNSLAIGLGFKNSDLIVIQNGTSIVNFAAGAARAYAGGDKNDWYLPTTTELNLLCQWNRGISSSVTTVCTNANIINSPTFGASSAGFVGEYYWSSSEVDPNEAWSQSFFNGEQYGFTGKDQDNIKVRPIRAF